ncbi:MAG: hypothetical protein K1W40_09620, partial [Schaedlerella sp.]|uniref:hypothetical protein n=1 Tax=Schaedlerella sp. TaxID=2676057 RepID=UPI003528F71D
MPDYLSKLRQNLHPRESGADGTAAAGRGAVTLITNPHFKWGLAAAKKRLLYFPLSGILLTVPECIS